MAKSVVNAGICGFRSEIAATANDMNVTVTLLSDCPHMAALAEKLRDIDPFAEISYRGEGPRVLRAAAECLPHPACPVPAGIIKTIEVEFGLALPADASIVLATES